MEKACYISFLRIRKTDFFAISILNAATQRECRQKKSLSNCFELPDLNIFSNTVIPMASFLVSSNPKNTTASEIAVIFLFKESKILTKLFICALAYDFQTIECKRLFYFFNGF